MIQHRTLGVVVFALLCLLLRPASVPGGEIQGRVLLAGDVPAPKKVPITIDQYVCGTEQLAGDLKILVTRLGAEGYETLTAADGAQVP